MKYSARQCGKVLPLGTFRVDFAGEIATGKNEAFVARTFSFCPTLECLKKPKDTSDRKMDKFSTDSKIIIDLTIDLSGAKRLY